MSIAIYPGSFDPITLGHINIVERAAPLFDKLYVCIMTNSSKAPLFTLEERVDLMKRTLGQYKNVEIDTSDDLLVRYARSKDAKVIIKGLRAVSDFDWEFQMALANKKIDSEIETFFIASSERYTYLSSTIVKEMARYKAPLDKFVPQEIIKDIMSKF